VKKQVFVTSTGSQNTLRIFYNGKDPGAKADLPPGIQEETGLVSVIPVVGTMYGFNLQPGASQGSARSAQSVSETISADGKVWGRLQISDGPAIGSEIVAGVARVGVVAAGIAVAIAAALGWWISQHMSAPLVALTGSTRSMAAGDLSVRAEVSGQDEFGALARSFNDMAVQVEKMVGSLRRFASDAAHELQTPLTALHTNLELARQDQPANSALEQAWAQVARLEGLCSDLLDLSRIEANPEEPGGRVEISALLRETCEPYASEAEQIGRSFHLDLPESEVFVCANAGHLRRALANLFENALKFTPEGGSVRAGLQVEANVARIWVEDTGIGIPPEDLPFIFQRFHRARNASPYPGSGLGLAIVQAIVQRYGGQVRVEALAPGTRFEIQFSVKTESI
jgi:signal transduction histidine kinase